LGLDILSMIQTHCIGLDRKSWISKYPLDPSPLLPVPLPGGQQQLHCAISSFQQLLVASSSSGCSCYCGDACGLISAWWYASPACRITSAYLVRLCRVRRVDTLRLKSSLLMAPGVVGLHWCSKDRLGLEHHLVRLHEHHGKHVHDGVPLLLCLRPWRCLLQPRRVTIMKKRRRM
jgi:hypothetical protein